MTGERPTLSRRSVTLRWVWLGLAFAWVVVAVGVIYGYHIAEPKGVLSVNTGRHTYWGNPPALTLHERDPISFEIGLGFMGAVLIVGLVDLSVRTRRGMTRAGAGAIAAGALLVLYSLFGLVVGLLAIGSAGALVVLSGLPIKSSAARP
jgi:hypothetical protein